MTITLNSIEDAFKFLQTPDEQLDGAPFVALGGEWAKMWIHIEGPNYHASVPGPLARGLWELQQEVYRAVAFARFGVDDIRRIPKPELEQYNLVFDVTEGTTGLLAPLESFLNRLADNLVNKMTPQEISKLVVAVALIFGTFYGATEIVGGYHEHRTAVETARLTAQVRLEEIEMEKARILAMTQQEQIRADLVAAVAQRTPELQRFQQAAKDGASAVVKGARDATEVTLGSVTLDKPQIAEVTQRADRETSDNIGVLGSYYIVGFKRPQGSDVARFTLTNAEGEFSVIMDFSDHESFTPEQLTRFWAAAANATPINLHVQKRLVGDKVRHAWVDGIPDIAPSANLAAR